MWHDLFSVSFHNPWQCDMTYFLPVAVHTDNVTWPIFCLLQCTLTILHDLFSACCSAHWQCDMTYFLPVAVHPDNVTWPIFCPFSVHTDSVSWPIFCLFQCTLTMWHDLFTVCFIGPWQCDMTYFLPVSVLPDNVSWPIFCPFQCSLTVCHDLFSAHFSAPWQCVMTYFPSVSVLPDYVGMFWPASWRFSFTDSPIIHFPLVSTYNLHFCSFKALTGTPHCNTLKKWSQIFYFFQYIKQKLQNGFIKLLTFND